MGKQKENKNNRNNKDKKRRNANQNKRNDRGRNSIDKTAIIMGGAVLAFALWTSTQKVQIIKEPTIVRVPTAIITPQGVHNTTYNYNVRAGIESGGINITHSADKATTTAPPIIQDTPTAPQTSNVQNTINTVLSNMQRIREQGNPKAPPTTTTTSTTATTTSKPGFISVLPPLGGLL